jgi:hypothetical protein
VEVRQNTRSLEVNAYQALMAEIGDLGTIAIENPQFNARMEELLRLSSEELRDAEISSADRDAVSNFFFMLLRHGDLAYYQFQQGIISEARLQSAINPLRLRLCRPVFQSWYRSISETGSGLVQDYRSFIESIMEACE